MFRLGAKHYNPYTILPTVVLCGLLSKEIENTCASYMVHNDPHLTVP